MRNTPHPDVLSRLHYAYLCSIPWTAGAPPPDSVTGQTLDHGRLHRFRSVIGIAKCFPTSLKVGPITFCVQVGRGGRLHVLDIVGTIFVSGVLRVTRMHRPRGIIDCFKIRQVAQSGCGITTYCESNAGSIRRQLNVGKLKIISSWVISFANPPPFCMLKVRGG